MDGRSVVTSASEGLTIMVLLIGPRRTVINRGFAYWSVVDGRSVVTSLSK